MLQKFTGIVLNVVKYSDTRSIANVFTEENGRMSFMVPISRSRKSSVSPILFQPFSLIEFEADVRPRSSIHSIKEVRLWHQYSSLQFDPFKSGILLFLSEFLVQALKEEERNEPLYAYVVNSLLWLDACGKGFANFHLVFLMRLSRFLGLYPNVDDYSDNSYFDLINACFVAAQPLHGMFVGPIEASKIVNLMRMKFETMYLFEMNRIERNRCLDIIIQYYKLHLPEFNELKSLRVLQELYS